MFSHILSPEGNQRKYRRPHRSQQAEGAAGRPAIVLAALSHPPRSPGEEKEAGEGLSEGGWRGSALPLLSRTRVRTPHRSTNTASKKTTSSPKRKRERGGAREEPEHIALKRRARGASTAGVPGVRYGGVACACVLHGGGACSAACGSRLRRLSRAAGEVDWQRGRRPASGVHRPGPASCHDESSWIACTGPSHMYAGRRRRGLTKEGAKEAPQAQQQEAEPLRDAGARVEGGRRAHWQGEKTYAGAP